MRCLSLTLNLRTGLFTSLKKQQHELFEIGNVISNYDIIALQNITYKQAMEIKFYLQLEFMVFQIYYKHHEYGSALFSTFPIVSKTYINLPSDDFFSGLNGLCVFVEINEKTQPIVVVFLSDDSKLRKEALETLEFVLKMNMQDAIVMGNFQQAILWKEKTTIQSKETHDGILVPNHFSINKWELIKTPDKSHHAVTCQICPKEIYSNESD